MNFRHGRARYLGLPLVDQTLDVGEALLVLLGVEGLRKSKIIGNGSLISGIDTVTLPFQLSIERNYRIPRSRSAGTCSGGSARSASRRPECRPESDTVICFSKF